MAPVGSGGGYREPEKPPAAAAGTVGWPTGDELAAGSGTRRDERSFSSRRHLARRLENHTWRGSGAVRSYRGAGRLIVISCFVSGYR